MARHRSGARRAVQWLIGIVVIVVVLFVAVAVAIPALVPVDTLRGRITGAVHDATGRDLAINGGLSLSVFPTLAVSARDVSFSNAPWAASRAMARLDRIDFRLRLLPLLSGRVEIASFVLEGPQIYLETDKQGHGNWDFGAANPALASGSAPAPAVSGGANASKQSGGAGGGGTGGLSEIALGDVRIQNGKLVYTDGASGQAQTLDQANLKVSLASLESPLAVTGSVRWHEKAVQLTMAAPNPRGVMGASGAPVQLKLAADPVSLSFDGTLAASGSPRAAGKIDLKVPSLRDLIAWSSGKPFAFPGKGLGPVAFAGDLAIEGPKISLKGAQLSFDAIKGTGDLAFVSGGARPSLSGQLTVAQLDLNPYLPEEAAKPAQGGAAPAPASNKSAAPAPAAKAETSGWSDDPIDASALKSADVDLALAADGIVYRAVETGKTQVHIGLAGGKLAAALADMALYQGHVTGKVGLDATGPALALDAQLKVDKVQVQPLLKAAAQYDSLSGAAQIDTTLSAKGRSQRELVSALAGRGQLNLQNGVLRGVDLVGMVKGAVKSVTGGGGGGGETDFNAAKASYTIAAGILSSNDLDIDAQLFSATGAGTVDMPKRMVNYRLMPKLIGAISVPVNVQGPWDKISWSPDLAGAVVGTAGNAAKLVEKGAKGLGSLGGGALKGLLGN